MAVGLLLEHLQEARASGAGSVIHPSFFCSYCYLLLFEQL
jgi:hypothetical protein